MEKMKNIPVRLPKRLADKLAEYSEQSGKPQILFIRVALEKLFRELEATGEIKFQVEESISIK